MSEDIVRFSPPPIPSRRRRGGFFNDNGSMTNIIDDSNNIDLLDISQSSGRTISTTLRLRRQGFQESNSSSGNDFAVKSIRRGSEQWHSLLRPFVSDLVFCSLIQRRFPRPQQRMKNSFRPYHCSAAALFVDLSNYSKITAALAHKGAHTISGVVNAYLGRILNIVDRYGGDVVKFAGDAVLIVWEGNQENLEMNVLTAAQCVMELQRHAGSHEVDDTDYTFHIHCGLCCGSLESEVFVAPSHVHMQKLYHSIGGECVIHISDLVNFANAGEVCISDVVENILGERGKYRDVSNGDDECKLLTDLVLDESLLISIEERAEDIRMDRSVRRKEKIEEGFIHPSVIELLSHGGLSPTQISQMRNLCVLFIAMTSNGSSVNWLMEVQSVLDRNRCPIVQIIDDDKGVHLIAAINLYESIPECTLLGLDVCRELVEKQVGCSIGMASGSTFCGVTGSSSVACRWDITGFPPVRAARLMQYALGGKHDIAIDQSVYDDPMAATRMELLESGIFLKGTREPVAVYQLSKSKSYAAFRVLETTYGRVHCDVMHEIAAHIQQDASRVAIVVTGLPLAGKKIVCQRAAGLCGLVPYLHLADASAGFLQLANTIAVWFQYVDHGSIRSLASGVLDHIAKSHWCRAHDQCIELIDLALTNGFKACFLVDRVQFLDEFSLSLIRECLRSKVKSRRLSKTRNLCSSSLSNSSEHNTKRELNSGKICFLCVHVPLYNWKSASDVVEDIQRDQLVSSVPVIELTHAKREELRNMFRDLSDMEVEERWLDAYGESSGYCAGYFITRAAAVRVLSGKLWSQGKRSYAETTKELVLHIPPGMVYLNKKLPVSQVSGEVAMKFLQVFDELPPLFKTTAKVLTIASKTGFYSPPCNLVWEVLNDLIAEGVELDVFDSLILEMTELFLVKKNRDKNEDILLFQSPALADVAFDVSTPIQIERKGKALIDRLGCKLGADFRLYFVMASLHHLVDKNDTRKLDFWREGYKYFLEASLTMNVNEVNRWKETLDDEIRASGFESKEVLGGNLHVPVSPKEVVGKRLPLLKVYSAPVSLGPMGHSLSVITRNTFHEMGIFNGYSSETAARLRDASRSAGKRYLAEMYVIEQYLSVHGFSGEKIELDQERQMIQFMSEPASSEADVQHKAATILDEFIPRFVETRLQRLYKLVDKLRESDEVPDVIKQADKAIQLAYKALRAPDKCSIDSAQDALVIMATLNWRPKPVPEYLPLLHYQTVARIRNKVLKRLNEAELFMSKHQQTYRDFECFLIVTPLLYQSEIK